MELSIPAKDVKRDYLKNWKLKNPDAWKLWYEKNKDKRRKYNKDWSEKHPHYFNEWYKKNWSKLDEAERSRMNEKQRIRNKVYRDRHPEFREKAKITGKIWRDKLKTDVINHYSKGTNKCLCCDVLGEVFLTIDHINGGGSKHKKTLSSKAVFYSWLRKNDYPNGFQVLCWNCNLAKSILGECPHRTSQ